jgi:gamma-glutamyl-gamma-aminobutyrate hydrolase PuuD
VPDVVRSDAHRVSIGQFQDNVIQSVAGSQVESIVGPSVTVSCHHHQAVAEVGAGLVPTAHAQDGLVEAVEDPGRPFVIGVQWHPEEGGDPSLAIALVRAARFTRTKRDRS